MLGHDSDSSSCTPSSLSAQTVGIINGLQIGYLPGCGDLTNEKQDLNVNPTSSALVKLPTSDFDFTISSPPSCIFDSCSNWTWAEQSSCMGQSAQERYGPSCFDVPSDAFWKPKGDSAPKAASCSGASPFPIVPVPPSTPVIKVETPRHIPSSFIAGSMSIAAQVPIPQVCRQDAFPRSGDHDSNSRHPWHLPSPPLR